MSTAVVRPGAEAVAPNVSAPGPRGHELWPLAAAVVGYPLWWVLGLAGFVPIVATLPMAAQLWRRRAQLRLPPAFGWWLLFLVWVLISVTALRADAPGAVPGAGGLGRVGLFVYRLGWYVASTLVLVWAVNLRRSISFAQVADLVGWMFVFCTAGGLAGILLPHVEFRSVVEVLLPERATANAFVQTLVHPGLSDIQYVLGYPEARPKAPFNFANTWGSVFSLSLPFFWVGWLMRGRRWQRVVAPFVLVAAAVPMVFSLNRGLWVSLVVGLVVVVVRQAARGRAASLVVVLVVAVAASVALVASPLGTIVLERLNHGHSNERRSLLLQATVASASEGSPIIGFGSTRDVQGNFASIAGGSTADCAACGVPPLGTQGHIWLVIFSDGLVGAGLFVLFLALVLIRFARCRGPADTVGTLLLVFFLIQVFVYDTLGLPLMLVMLAVGLAARAGRVQGAGVAPPPTLREGLGALRRLVPLAVVLGCVGLAAGLVYAWVQPRTYTATSRVALTLGPAVLGQPSSPRRAAAATIDTESGLLLSDSVLSSVVQPGETTAALRDRVSVSAPANTSLLVVAVTSASADEAQGTADSIARRYLLVRSASLAERRTDTLDRLNGRWRTLSGLVLRAQEPVPGAGSGAVPRTRRPPPVAAELQVLGRTIAEVTVTPVSAGSIVRSDPARLDARELGKLGGSGLAAGVLAGLVGGLVPRTSVERSSGAERRGPRR